MRTRQAMLASDLFGSDLAKLFPVLDEDGSDSAIFDNCLEFLHLSGRSLPHSIMMMIPEPWEKNHAMPEDIRAFYEYHSTLMEPWDGPAHMAFTDGTIVGACLDRNGFRPSRYYITKDDNIVLASEAGVLDTPSDQIAYKGRLQPGTLLLIDTKQGRIISDQEVKKKIASEHPYRQWLDQNLIPLSELPSVEPRRPEPDHGKILQRQRAFGYTYEDLKIFLSPMSKIGPKDAGIPGSCQRWQNRFRPRQGLETTLPGQSRTNRMRASPGASSSSSCCRVVRLSRRYESGSGTGALSPSSGPCSLRNGSETGLWPFPSSGLGGRGKIP